MDDQLPDLLTETDQALLRLERSPRDAAALSDAIRLMRGVRRTPGFLGRPRLEPMARRAETVLAHVRDGALTVTPDLITAMLRALDRIRAIMAGTAAAGTASVEGDSGVAAALDALLRGAGSGAARTGDDWIDHDVAFGAGTPLPPRLASVLIVEAAGERFAMPQAWVAELVRTGVAGRDGPGTYGTVGGGIGRTPASRPRSRSQPLVHLSDLLRLRRTGPGRSGCPVVVACGPVGIVVDRVLGTERVLVKPVAPILRRATMFSGTATLGDDAVVMMLDPDGIARTIGERAPVPMPVARPISLAAPMRSGAPDWMVRLAACNDPRDQPAMGSWPSTDGSRAAGRVQLELV